jgi:hypothetical protein
MLPPKSSKLSICATLAALPLLQPSSVKADILLYSLQDITWGNTGPQGNSPASFIVSFGACTTGSAGSGPPGCGDFGNGNFFLDPIVFLPSGVSQSVTVSSEGNFSEFANAISSSSFNFSVPRILSNSIVAPSTFPTESQSSSGIIPGFPGADIISIVISIGPFVFQGR